VPTTKETIAHPFALHEAYEVSGHRQPFTRKTGREHAVLDFIWCSRHMHVAAVLRPLQWELRPQVDRCFLPNRWHPSDHLPIGAVLQLSSGAAEAAAAPAGAAAVAAADAGAAAAAAAVEPT
jgi:CCR4-NOT transcription complex subunit 6